MARAGIPLTDRPDIYLQSSLQAIIVSSLVNRVESIYTLTGSGNDLRPAPRHRIAAGELGEVLAGLRRPIPNFYGCVHTDGFPGGSIRGAIRRGGGNNDNDD